MWLVTDLVGMTIGMIFLPAVTQGRLAIRKLRLADLLGGLIAVFIITGPHPVPVFSVAMRLGDLWLWRFGFLAFLASWIVQTTLLYFPLTIIGCARRGRR